MKSKLAKARDEWLKSDEGERCCGGQAKGQFLRNRVKAAFIAGWGYCERLQKEKPE